VLLSEALAIERESGHQPRLGNALQMSARLAASDGQPARAIRLYARAALLLEEVHGLTIHVGWPEPNLDELRAQVGAATFEQEWQRGRAMTLLEAIDQASRNDEGRARADAPRTIDRTTAPSR
jgi:hypothetical protein